jgi:FAD/FMN-containing dehydrogenase
VLFLLLVLIAILAAVGVSRWHTARRRTVETDPRAHAHRLARIAAQLHSHPADRPVSLRKRGAPHQVPKRGDLRRRDHKIDVGDLTSILDIDPFQRVCVAEAGVRFVDLVAATLEYGLMPIVVPELKTITIGGAVSGCSIESASFKHGGFHDTCIEYEVVTANGDVLCCTPYNANRLVFQMMHGSFGTLGILTKLTFRLIPAKRYVHVEYEKYDSLAEFRGAIWRHFKLNDIDFMDGFIHSPTEYVLCSARFVDEVPYVNRYDWTKIYYRSTLERTEDFLATPDYLFRYDHGVTSVHPKSWLGRLLFAKAFGSAQALWLADKANWMFSREHPTVTLDMFLPFSRAPKFLDWYREEIHHYPLWVVPYRRVHDYEWIDNSFYAGLSDELFLDIAIYGLRQPRGKNVHRMIETELAEVGGIKTLISHNYYSRDEFWSTWNKSNYDAVKAITDPNNVFRDLYDKTCRAAMGVS